MNFETNSSLAEASFQYKRSALPQDTNPGSKQLYLSSEHVMNTEKIPFHGEAEIASFSLKKCKAEGIIGIAGKIQTVSLFFFDKSADQNLTSKSNVLPS